MHQARHIICNSAAVEDGGKAVRFTCRRNGATVPAFAVRYDGRVHAYVNSCAHIPVELDWIEGEFFDKSGLYLICSTHGATYEPDSGVCVMGPCKGERLVALQVIEDNGKIYLLESDTHYG